MRYSPRHVLLPIAALGVLSGCGGDTTSPPAVVRAADHLVFAVAPSDTAESGAALARQPVIQVVDAAGQAFASAGVAIAVTVDGGATVTGAAAVTTDASGRATFAGLGVAGLAGARTLAFAATALAPLSHPIAIVAGAATHLTLSAGDAQAATVGSALPVAPSVLVTDAVGNPRAGVTVTFAIAAGGGSEATASAISGASGMAVGGTWTLGTVAGANTLTATAPGAPPVTLHAIGTAGPAAAVVIIRGDGQSAPVGQAVPVDPAVQVRDQYGNVTAGTAQFAVTAGGGAVAPSGTDAAGSQSARWSLGALGTNTLTATSGSASVTFTATGTPIVSQFQITLSVITPLTASQAAAFDAARTRWSRAVVGDLPDTPVNVSAGQCFATQPAVNQMVDDILIFVEVDSIDGPGKVLGQAGPCFLRPGAGLPVVGVMEFDVADLDQIEASGELTDVITHEMAHVLGFGTLWAARSLVTGLGSADPFFTGAAAQQEFVAVGGTVTYVGTPVPVENLGGAGTAGVHWREAVMTNELMTGYVSGTPNPLSVVTIGSLRDLGYVVDLSAADSYSLLGGLRGGAVAPRGPVRAIVESPLASPILVLDGRGRPVSQRPR